MIHKRGLSPVEIENIDPELFNYLYVYDSVIEPNGTYYDMVKYANLCHLILMSSGNLSEDGSKNASVMDWDLFGVLSGKSTKERHDEQKEKQKQKEIDGFNKMAELIKKQAVKKKDKK